MYFVITRNLLDGEDMVKTNFPANKAFSVGFRGEKKEPGMINMPHRFRLLDDDGEIYFLGWSDDCDSEKAFSPLDEFGAGYGCTSIEYMVSGKWEVL